MVYWLCSAIDRVQTVRTGCGCHSCREYKESSSVSTYSDLYNTYVKADTIIQQLNIQLDQCFISQYPLLVRISQLYIHLAKEMLKINLKNHDPETIYERINIEVGACYMLLKSGHAIITFDDPKDSAIAETKFRNRCIEGRMLNVSKYVDGELDAVRPQENTVLSQQGMSLENGGEGMDIEYKSKSQEAVFHSNKKNIELTIKKHEKFRQLVNEKITDLEVAFPVEEERNREINAFDIFLKTKFSTFSTQYCNMLNGLAGGIRNFTSEPLPIQLDPEISDANPLAREKKIEDPIMEEQIEYINIQGFQLKRIAILDDEHFITTLRGKFEGAYKCYSVLDENPYENQKVAQVPYGLMKLEDYVLMGNAQGSINFFNLKQERNIEITKKLHDNLIFKLKYFNNAGCNPKVLSLGMDDRIKLWQIEEEKVYEGWHSLCFHSRGDVETGNKTADFEVIDEETIAYASMRKLILNKWGTNSTSSIISKCSISKLKKFTHNLLSFSAENLLELVDLRVNHTVSSLAIGQSSKLYITALEVLSDNLIFYGGSNNHGNGLIGTVDTRFMKGDAWSNSDVHKGKISDAVKQGRGILVGDSAGKLIRWKQLQAL